MRAAYIERTGPAEEIKIGDLPRPIPGDGEILVSVRAASVNPHDTYVRSGLTGDTLSFPCILGSDFAGIVEETGTNVTRFNKGDRVWGIAKGTYAEYTVAKENWTFSMPEGITDDDAVAVALVGITAHLGVAQHANLQPGEIIFVRGGSGAVGTILIQMGKILGATVIATAGNADKCHKTEEFGADLSINYRVESMEEKTREIAPDGVNVFFDVTRQPDFDLAVSLTAPYGRIVILAGRLARPVFPVGPFYLKNCTLHGYQLFLASPVERLKASVDISHWLKEGMLQPNIDRVMPLERVAEAHRLQEENTINLSGMLAGKIIISPINS